MRKTDHLYTPEVRAKISAAMQGNTNGKGCRGTPKPGSRASGVQNLKQAVPARMRSPRGGPFATCAWARDFVLISPDGVRHEGRNVKLFVREHPGLFDASDLLPKNKSEFPNTNAAQRLAALLADPKRKSWKGWTKEES